MNPEGGTSHRKTTFASREQTLPPVFSLLVGDFFDILVLQNEGRERLATVLSFKLKR